MRLLCFQCYRADLERNRSLLTARSLNTASNERFQAQLPFEPVDGSRLQMLKAERTRVLGGVEDATARRRRAQIAARRAVQAAASAASDARERALSGLPERTRAIAAAIHAAELQLPESWIPFVVAR